MSVQEGVGPFTCPVCGMTSHNATDKQEGYCGRCHAFTGTEPMRYGMLPALTVAELRVVESAIHVARGTGLLAGEGKTERAAILRSLATAVEEAILGAHPAG